MSIRLLSTLLLLVLASALHAQPGNEDLESSAGTTYVIAFPDTTMNTFDARYPNLRHPDNAYMFIYSAVDNRVSIRGAGFTKTELLQAGKFTIVNLMDATARALPLGVRFPGDRCARGDGRAPAERVPEAREDAARSAEAERLDQVVAEDADRRRVEDQRSMPREVMRPAVGCALEELAKVEVPVLQESPPL